MNEGLPAGKPYGNLRLAGKRICHHSHSCCTRQKCQEQQIMTTELVLQKNTFIMCNHYASYI